MIRQTQRPGFALLPALETLEIVSSLIHPTSLIELVEARRRGARTFTQGREVV